MKYNLVRYEVDDLVATITLNNPEMLNAWSKPMDVEIRACFAAASDDPKVRAIVLTGAGRGFCAGQDTRFFKENQDAAGRGELTDVDHANLMYLTKVPKPIVAAINGPAAGAGIGLAAIGDIALSAPEAHFTSAYTAIGMTPDGGATWLLPRLIGLRRTMDLILTNRRVGADEAAAIGLVTRVTAPGALDEEAAALAVQLAAGPTIAYAVSRRLSLASLANGFEDHLAAESRAIAAQARGAEGREGVAAFLAKRPPHFAGPNE